MGNVSSVTTTVRKSPIQLDMFLPRNMADDRRISFNFMPYITRVQEVLTTRWFMYSYKLINQYSARLILLNHSPPNTRKTRKNVSFFLPTTGQGLPLCQKIAFGNLLFGTPQFVFIFVGVPNGIFTLTHKKTCAQYRLFQRRAFLFDNSVQ